MVNVVTVENNDCVFWNVHLIVHKVLSRIVGCSHPKRRVHALHLRKFETSRLIMFTYSTYFFNDGAYIREALFVFG